eukprot:3049342-Rhodomonas_salina.2
MERGREKGREGEREREGERKQHPLLLLVLSGQPQEFVPYDPALAASYPTSVPRTALVLPYPSSVPRIA